MRKSLPKAPPDRSNGLRTRKNGLKKTRRRLRPEQAENEIIEAAERFLRTHPFRALQVADLMDQTLLGRPSFYHYFRDRHDLIVRLVKRFGDEISEMNEVWFLSGDDPIADLHTGYERIGKFWTIHGPVMRAIADAATHDPDVEKAHRALVKRFIRGTAARIKLDIERGLIAPLDADATAEALIMMSEQVLNQRLGRRSRDWQPVIDTLATIWERALYGATESVTRFDR
jgi:TetR/AcrR family transcriptional regulator, ethionamide resistance regulator